MIYKSIMVLAVAAASIFKTACSQTNEKNYLLKKEKPKMETNKKLIQQAYSFFNSGDIKSYGSLFSPDTKNHGVPVGREGIVFVVSDIRHTFPDIILKQVEVFAEGDWVISRDIFKGTFKNKATVPHHGGLLMTHEPTNKSFAVQHIHLFKIENGLITEHYATRDDVEMYQQLGVLPPAPVFAPPANTKVAMHTLIER
jgi:predicted SnoaL-like aldol condensation-catalyzing enzyme